MKPHGLWPCNRTMVLANACPAESIEQLLQRLDSAIAVVKHCTPSSAGAVEKLLQRNLAVSHLVQADLVQVHSSAALGGCVDGEDSGNPISRDERITHSDAVHFFEPCFELTLFVVDGLHAFDIAHFTESQPLRLDADLSVSRSDASGESSVGSLEGLNTRSASELHHRLGHKTIRRWCWLIPSYRPVADQKLPAQIGPVAMTIPYFYDRLVEQRNRSAD